MRFWCFSLCRRGVQAASATWAVSATDANWSNGTNWGGSAPGDTSAGASGTSDVATFNAPVSNGFGSSGTPIAVDSGRTIGGVTFDTSTGSYFLGATGGNPLYLSSGQIQLTSAVTGTVTETFNNNLILSGTNASYTLANASANGGFNFRGSITGSNSGTTTLVLGGTNTGSNFLHGVIGNGSGGALSLVKNGTGYWMMDAANTYSGGTTISGGTLALGGDSSGNENVNALGSGTVTLAGGQLRFGGMGGNPVSYTIANNLVSTGGTIFVGDGVQHLTGAFNASSGTTNLYTQWGGKDLYLDGVLSGSGSLVIDSPNAAGNGGAATYITNNANTYSGTVTVNPASSGFSGGLLIIGANNTLANASVVNNGRSGA